LGLTQPMVWLQDWQTLFGVPRCA